MQLVTTLLGREVAVSALENVRDLIHKRGALDRRLEFPEKSAKEALSTNGYVAGVFSEVPETEEGDVSLEFKSANSAKHLRVALIQWTAMASKKDQSVHGMALITDIDSRRAEAQGMLNQLNDQLSLGVEDISALADASLGKKPKPEPGDSAPAEDGGAGTKQLWDDGDDEDDDGWSGADQDEEDKDDKPKGRRKK